MDTGKEPSDNKRSGAHVILLVLLVTGVILGSALYLLGEPLLESLLKGKSSRGQEVYETARAATDKDRTETQAPETQAPQTETRPPETQAPQTETRPPETQPPQTETQPPETEAYGYQPGIHKYEGVKVDCDWSEAYLGASNRTNEYGEPGHLLTIETQEELEHIIKILGTDNPPIKEYYLSAARLDEGRDYYWIGNEGRSYGECINAEGSPFDAYWYPGEPSFRDLDGTQENRLALMFVRDENTGIGRWYLNDVSATALKTIENYSGKIGYLVEYEARNNP